MRTTAHAHWIVRACRDVDGWIASVTKAGVSLPFAISYRAQLGRVGGCQDFRVRGCLRKGFPPLPDVQAPVVGTPFLVALKKK